MTQATIPVELLERFRSLFNAAHNLMVYLGRTGHIASDSRVADTLMNCLHDIDGGDSNNEPYNAALQPAPSQPVNAVQMDEVARASLRHFLSAAMIFSPTWPKEPVTAQQKAHGDVIYARTLAAFDEWFALHDAHHQVSNPQAQGVAKQ